MQQQLKNTVIYLTRFPVYSCTFWSDKNPILGDNLMANEMSKFIFPFSLAR